MAPNTRTVPIGSVKISVPIKASALPISDYVYAGPHPVLMLTLQADTGGAISVSLPGKAFAKIVIRLLPRIASGEDPTVILQGSLTSDRSLRSAGMVVVDAKS